MREDFLATGSSLASSEGFSAALTSMVLSSRRRLSVCSRISHAVKTGYPILAHARSIASSFPFNFESQAATFVDESNLDILLSELEIRIRRLKFLFQEFEFSRQGPGELAQVSVGFGLVTEIPGQRRVGLGSPEVESNARDREL